MSSVKPGSKKARRQHNFGTRNTVRPTLQRKLHDQLGHRAPKSALNDNGTVWKGFSHANPRKPWPAEPSWRVWWAENGRRNWRIDRALAEATEEYDRMKRIDTLLGRAA